MTTRLTVRSMPCGRSRPGSGSRRPCSVDLDVAAGERVVIVGGAGTGKTACALALSGFAEDLPAGMRVFLGGEDVYTMAPLRRAQLIGTVPSQPNLVFSCIGGSVYREMELCFSFLGCDPDSRRIQEMATMMGLGHLMDRDPLSLSGGEKVRLAIALGLLKTPAVMIFDDSLRELDPESERDIRGALDAMRHARGMVAIEFQTRPRDTALTSVGQWVFITPQDVIRGPLDACWRSVAARDPGLLPPCAALAARLEQVLDVSYPCPPDSPAAVAAPLLPRRPGHIPVTSGTGRADSAGRGEARLEVSRLSYRYPNSPAFCLGPLSHVFMSGTVTSVLGLNGAGKTTALRCLGNLIADWAGEIEVLPGLSARRLRLPGWAHAAMYCFQCADDQLFLGTVREEMSIAASYTRGKSCGTAARVDRLAEDFGVSALLDASPTELPRPLRRLVTLGAALVAAPPVILLDEPTVDLDEDLIRRVSEAIRRYCREGGTVILVSHDYDFVGNVSDEVLLLEDGSFSRTAKRAERSPWPTRPEPCATQVARWVDGNGFAWAERDLIGLLT